MSRRSWLWWAAALVLVGGNVAYGFARPDASFGWFAYGGFCAGFELQMELSGFLWPVGEWLVLVWYSGAPAIVLGLAAHWLTSRFGWARAGRVAARTLAGVLLLFYGPTLLGLAMDAFAGRDCLGLAPRLLLADATLPPALAALCVFMAVRTPRRRIRRSLRLPSLRRFHRFLWGGSMVAAICMLVLLPAADVGPGRAPTDCDTAGRVGERAVLCLARLGGGYRGVPDNVVLAHARALCAAYTGEPYRAHIAEPICPRITADLRRIAEEDEAEFQAWEDQTTAACDRGRHRPRVKPVVAGHERILTEAGIMTYEDTAESSEAGYPGESDLLLSATGSLNIAAGGDYPVCVTVEAYRKAPPLEVRGWEQVQEVGYLSPGGELVLYDGMGGPSELPNLAISGKGHYRVRAHYRVSHDEGVQHLLVMVFPGGNDRVIDYVR